jgi:hypothetical protein
MKETELAAAVVAYLRDLGWDVHQEVGGPGPRADIVAVKGPLLYVIETKMTLGLSVLGQARNWLGYANRVSVATPQPSRYRNRTERYTARAVLQDWGIGLLEVSCRYSGETEVREELAPKLWRQTPTKCWLRDRLCDETRTYAAAGNNEGKFWSPFKATIAEIHRALKETPGLTTRQLVDRIKHHYHNDSLARSALPAWLRYGKIPGVRGGDEHPMRWYLAA